MAIEAVHLTKRYGDVLAVDDLSFSVQPGIVTGFLGPNGAGKSTTMRMIVGLDQPSSGSVTIDGRAFADQRHPLREVGVLLEAKSIHPGRTARDHLLTIAATAGIGRRRVDEVLGLVGLADVGGKRAGSFSLGMGQRLGLASALLADPATLILDEPVNGLDLDGIRWIRGLLKSLAGEGRTVFLSSHLMDEMSQVAEHVVVLAHGHLLRDQPMAELIAEAATDQVRVRTSDPARLAAVVAGDRVTVTDVGNGLLEVKGRAAHEIGELAARHGVVLHELTPQGASLEDAYLALTEGEVRHRASAA